MSNGFQFFEGTTTESATAARITVRKGGILVLTRAAIAMLGDEVVVARYESSLCTGAADLGVQYPREFTGDERASLVGENRALGGDAGVGAQDRRSHHRSVR